MKEIEIDHRDLADLIFYARRYCDRRKTYACREFNDIYKRIWSDNPDFIRTYDKMDRILRDQGKFWPYVQDGDYNEETGAFDAR